MLSIAANKMGLEVNIEYSACECLAVDLCNGVSKTLTVLPESEFIKSVLNELEKKPLSYLCRVDSYEIMNDCIIAVSSDVGEAITNHSLYTAYAACCAALVLKSVGAVSRELHSSIRKAGNRFVLFGLDRLMPYTEEDEAAEAEEIKKMCEIECGNNLDEIRECISVKLMRNDSADRREHAAETVKNALLSNPTFSSKWRDLKYVNTGTYGFVYRAVSADDGKACALKVMNVGDDAEKMEKALNESSNAMRFMSNEYTVKMYDFGITMCNNDKYIWISMEYLEPIPCETRDEKMAAAMAIDICRALEGIHNSGGMVHRDIKPSNILRGRDRWKLCDFGITRPVEGRDYATVIGTVDYMAPELLSAVISDSGYTRYDSTVDIYALGLTMYSLLNRGELPFVPTAPFIPTASDRRNAKVRRIQGEKFPIAVNCSEQLMRIIHKACAARPEERYKTAGHMREALEAYFDD